MKIAQRIGVLLALSFWFLVIASIVGVMPEMITQLFLYSGLIIFLVHGVELFCWRRALRCYSQNKLKDALMVLLFGIFHLAKLMPRANLESDASNAQ